MTETKSNRGRKPKYAAVEEMQEKIDAYFAQCFADERPVTISGLAYTLDMTTQGLREYAAKDEFSSTVKKAKQRVEIALEERLNGQSPTGAIFNLKNNFGWKDKSESEISGAGGGPIVTKINLVAADINGA